MHKSIMNLPRGVLTGVSWEAALSADLGIPRFLDFDGEGANRMTTMITQSVTIVTYC